MDKKIILIDIDHTIINSNSLVIDKKKLFTKFFRKYYTADEIKKLWEIYSNIFRNEIQELSLSLKSVVFKFAAEINFDQNNLWLIFKEIYENLNYKNAKINESVYYLAKLRNLSNLGIFSEGDKWYQMLKLKKSGLFKFFNKKNLYIYQNKLGNLAKIPKNSLFVDDSERIEAGVKKARNDIKFIKVEKDIGITQSTYNEILSYLKN